MKQWQREHRLRRDSTRAKMRGDTKSARGIYIRKCQD